MATELYTKEEYCLENDKLNRGKQADLLIKYIEKIEKNFVMNINSPFGTGKSFFLGLLEEKLEVKNNYKVININAWENDDQNPAMMFLAEIYSVFREEKSENELVIVEKAISLGKDIIKNGSKLGINLFFEKYFSSETAKKMRETLDVENLSFKDFFKVFEDSFKEKKDPFKSEIEDYIKRKDSRTKFKKELEKLTKTKKLIIMIDDLDRCKPTFALELLETVKHVFDISGIIFILATDFDQLKHTVSRVYGEIENEGYLKRFIDREFRLLKSNENEYIKELVQKNKMNYHAKDRHYIWTHFLLENIKSLRGKEKAMLVMGEYKNIFGSYKLKRASYLIFLKVNNPEYYEKILNRTLPHNKIFLNKEENVTIFSNDKSTKNIFYKEFYDKLLNNFYDRMGMYNNLLELYNEFESFNFQNKYDLEECIQCIEFLS